MIYRITEETYIMPFDDIPVLLLVWGISLRVIAEKFHDSRLPSSTLISLDWKEIEWDYFLDDFSGRLLEMESLL